MKPERHKLLAAVYLVLIRDNQILMLRRSNTGWRDGEFTLPTGHVENQESMRRATCREALEEVAIVISEADIEFMHVMYRNDNVKEYVDFYFQATAWSGEPKNAEPEKCDALEWFDLNDLPSNVLPNVKQALADIQTKKFYSESEH